MLRNAALRRGFLGSDAVCCGFLGSDAACCGLQWCSGAFRGILRYLAEFCGFLRCDAECLGVLRRPAVCCGVLRCASMFSVFFFAFWRDETGGSVARALAREALRRAPASQRFVSLSVRRYITGKFVFLRIPPCVSIGRALVTEIRNVAPAMDI